MNYVAHNYPTYTASLPMRYGEAVPTATPVVAPSPDGMVPTAMPVVGPASSPAAAHARMQAHAHYRMRCFYNHLRMHPSYYMAAKNFAKRYAAGDPAAKASANSLIAQAQGGDLRALNTSRAIACVLKFEHMLPKGSRFSVSGFLPAASSTAGHFVRLVLSPAAWVLGKAGGLSHWAGDQFASLSRAL